MLKFNPDLHYPAITYADRLTPGDLAFNPHVHISMPCWTNIDKFRLGIISDYQCPRGTFIVLKVEEVHRADGEIVNDMVLVLAPGSRVCWTRGTWLGKPHK